MTKNQAIKKFIARMRDMFAETSEENGIWAPIERYKVKRGNVEFNVDGLPRIYLWAGDEDVTKENRFSKRELDIEVVLLFNPAEYRYLFQAEADSDDADSDLDTDVADAMLLQLQNGFNKCSYGNAQVPMDERFSAHEVANSTMYIEGDPSFMAVEISAKFLYATLN